MIEIRLDLYRVILYFINHLIHSLEISLWLRVEQSATHSYPLKNQPSLCQKFATIIELYIVKSLTRLYSVNYGTVEDSKILGMMGDPRHFFRFKMMN